MKWKTFFSHMAGSLDLSVWGEGEVTCFIPGSVFVLPSTIA